MEKKETTEDMWKKGDSGGYGKEGDGRGYRVKEYVGGYGGGGWSIGHRQRRRPKEWKV